MDDVTDGVKDEEGEGIWSTSSNGLSLLEASDVCFPSSRAAPSTGVKSPEPSSSVSGLRFSLCDSGPADADVDTCLSEVAGEFSGFTEDFE